MTTRCTYCLLSKPPTAFEQRGDHVVPASTGGAWVDDKVCDECNHRANGQADNWLSRDALVQFLRGAYRVRTRRGRAHSCRFSVQVSQGGVVRVTLDGAGVSYESGMPDDTIAELGLANPPDQGSLARLAAAGLGIPGESSPDALTLARAAQEFAAHPTPPPVWSRFMAKLGLACGREAYGDSWLDGPQASILSSDLLGSDPPRFNQRTHYPPVEPVWPYEPPAHRLWIEMYKDTAILHVVLFGQVLGVVPVSARLPPSGAYSAWSLDPRKRTFHRSSFPAIMLGTAAAKMTQAGHNVLLVNRPEHPLVYVEDGPDGPAELPIETLRATSPEQAIRLLDDLARQAAS